ncbi:MAG TPA: hypothetical protein VKB76_02350, partial [Ktedonobacterales bacterium]|nr:hypothetical protein [Ktedonobacterales bacterium]
YGDFPGESALFWSENESPTSLRIEPREVSMFLIIDGQHEAGWHVRWHAFSRVVEHDLGRCASATIAL